MAKAEISVGFKHESTYEVWVDIMGRAIAACQKAEKQLKRGQTLSISSMDFEINVMSAKAKKKKKK